MQSNSMSSPILLVEDTASLAMVYKTVLQKSGYEVVEAATLAQARAQYTKSNPRVILLDLLLPDGNGGELIPEFVAKDNDVKIIVITANGSINRAVNAMRDGSFDFLVKPFDENRLISAVRNADVALSGSSPGNQTHTDAAGSNGFIGSSAVMKNIYQMIDQIGKSTATVFLTGESGTGKEIAAHAIHDISGRAAGPFIPVNCGAIPRDLLESELFGHLKGSFTGAIANKIGAAEAANGGTLFLDEICEMDLALQTKILRFLQTSTIQPVGATTPKSVNVRIVCATNRNPLEEVRAGRFREDLYYRLHVVPIHLPPLRDRGDDIIELANEMLSRFSVEEKKDFDHFSGDVIDILRAHHWPGNVRQLMNVVRNVVVLGNGPIITADMLPPEMTQIADSRQNQATRPFMTSPPSEEKGSALSIAAFIGTPLALLEREFIEATIDFCDGSIPQAARLLDVSPSTLYRKKESWENS